MRPAANVIIARLNGQSKLQDVFAGISSRGCKRAAPYVVVPRETHQTRFAGRIEPGTPCPQGLRAEGVDLRRPQDRTLVVNRVSGVLDEKGSPVGASRADL